jgi:very-short-patch-repair endonuclease
MRRRQRSRRPEQEILAALETTIRGKTEAHLRRELDLSVRAVRDSLNELESKSLIEEVNGRYRSLNYDLSTDPNHEHEKPDRQEPHDRSPAKQGLLKRVCAFYADVAQELATSKIRLSDDAPELRSLIPYEQDWKLLADDRLRIRRNRLQGDGWTGSHEERFVFAGPLQLTREKKRGRKTTERLWLPVFLAHATTRRLPETVEFTLTGPIEINHEWLDAVYPTSDVDLRDDLLIRLGLLEETARGELRRIETRNMGDCLRALRQRIHELEWPAVTESRSSTRAWSPKSLDREGIYERMLLFPEKLSPYSKGLVQELRQMAQLDENLLRSTALRVLARNSEGGSSSQSPPDERDSLETDGLEAAQLTLLNPEQLQVVESSLADDITLVQGPPGTGKSTVVRSSMISCGVHGQTSIFASRNHNAVDAVVHPLQPEDEEAIPVISDLRKLKSNSAWLDLLVAALDAPRSEESRSLEELQLALRRAVAESQAARHRALAASELHSQLAELASRVRMAADALPIEITSRDPESIPIEPSAALKLLDAQNLPLWSPTRWLSAWGRRRLSKALESDGLPGLETDEPRLRSLAKWKHLSQESQELEEDIRLNCPSSSELGQRLFDALTAVTDLSQSMLADLPELWADSIRVHGQALSRLRSQLHRSKRSRNARRSYDQQLQADFEGLLPGLPLWAITNLSMKSKVPPVAGAFDLAIIDEAAQCDPASVMPILFRARRAMLVGDPQQLRPVSSLSYEREERLREKHGLLDPRFDYLSQAGRSAYEVVHDCLMQRSLKPILLREHYRCHPDIASFFSESFYESKLLVRTSAREISDIGSGLRWTHVPGGSETIRGSRWHEPQATAIVDELEELAERRFEGSVGVVTPFREHAKRIQDLAHQRLGPRQLQDWNFMSNTADGFQGGERDLILFGLVGGGGGPKETPQFYGRDRNRFNVAVSRARLLLHIFGDADWARRSDLPLLEQLESLANTPKRENDQGVRTDLIGPVWEPRLADAMRAAGIQYRQQYHTHNFYLDFALFPCGDETRKIDIEVDGETWHRDRSGRLRDEDVRRDLLLRADGWTVQRFWVYQLREDMDGCIQKIRKLLAVDATPA